jgi:hypothetical protein
VKRSGGKKKPAASRRRRDKQKTSLAQSKVRATAEMQAALERIAAASEEEFREYLKIINPEDAIKISQLLIKYAPAAEFLTHALAVRPDENIAIRNAGERLRHLRGDIPPRKWIILVVTWLCTTGGILTAVTAPETLPEINSQVSTLSLGVAVTVALISSRKND